MASSEQFYNAEQSWIYDRIQRDERTHGHAFRVRIRRNAYDDQSYIRGFVLDPIHLQWNLIVDQRVEGTVIEQANYGRKSEPVTPFRAVAHGVIDELKEIVGGAK